MDNPSFLDGVSAAVEKHAREDVTDQAKNWISGLFNRNVSAPAVQGYSDSRFGGLIKANPQTAALEPDMGAVLDTAWKGETRQPPSSAPKGLGMIGKGSYYAGRLASSLNPGIGDNYFNKKISDRSGGGFTLKAPGEIAVDRSKLLSKATGNAMDWAGNHKGLLLGGGLALAGGLAMMGNNSPRQSTQPPVAGPGQEQPAPYTGRDGVAFNKYQEQ